MILIINTRSGRELVSGGVSVAEQVLGRVFYASAVLFIYIVVVLFTPLMTRVHFKHCSAAGFCGRFEGSYQQSKCQILPFEAKAYTTSRTWPKERRPFASRQSAK